MDDDNAAIVEERVDEDDEDDVHDNVRNVDEQASRRSIMVKKKASLLAFVRMFRQNRSVGGTRGCQ